VPTEGVIDGVDGIWWRRGGGRKLLAPMVGLEAEEVFRTSVGVL